MASSASSAPSVNFSSDKQDSLQVECAKGNLHVSLNIQVDGKAISVVTVNLLKLPEEINRDKSYKVFINLHRDLVDKVIRISLSIRGKDQDEQEFTIESKKYVVHGKGDFFNVTFSEGNLTLTKQVLPLLTTQINFTNEDMSAERFNKRLQISQANAFPIQIYSEGKLQKTVILSVNEPLENVNGNENCEFFVNVSKHFEVYKIKFIIIGNEFEFASKQLTLPHEKNTVIVSFNDQGCPVLKAASMDEEVESKV